MEKEARKNNMKSLVIGNTSQLSFYFPEEFTKISSRNIDFSYLKKHAWDKIILAFGESRKFISNIESYEDVNFSLTIKIVEELRDFCNFMLVYSTCELWNRYDGKVNIGMPFSYYHTPYLESKHKLTSYILEREYKNVFVLFPFNFNSPLRNKNFLFGKIFDSIINKRKISIGDTYFHRDLIHPDYVVQETLRANEHKMIGSGRLTFVNDFIRDIFSKYNLEYDDFVEEDIQNFKESIERKEYYMQTKFCLFSYESLLSKTIDDIERYRCIM